MQAGPEPLRVVGAAIVAGGRCLAARRSEAMALPLLWEFPGGKVEPGESPPEALRREIREELGVEVEVLERLGTGRAPHGEREIELEVFLCRLVRGEPHPHEHDLVRWLGPEELHGLAWAPADLPLLAPLAAQLRAAGD